MKNRTIMNIKDSKDRPLAILRSLKSGKIQTLMFRYKDMTEEEKNIVRFFFNSAVEESNGECVSGETHGELKGIEDFLSFNEERLCG